MVAAAFSTTWRTLPHLDEIAEFGPEVARLVAELRFVQ
jgi:hypothetical protein